MSAYLFIYFVQHLNHSMFSSSGGSADASLSKAHFNASVLGTCRAGRTAKERRRQAGRHADSGRERSKDGDGDAKKRVGQGG